MQLDKIVRIKRNEKLAAELIEYLEENCECLPLDDACTYGGTPDHFSVRVCNVEITARDRSKIHATCSVSFDEFINTSTDDSVSFPQSITCGIVVNLSETEVSVSCCDQSEE